MAAEMVHATCIAVIGDGAARGVLLRGPSGAGKSDLALRMIDQGARLVADDQCELRRGTDEHGLAVLVATAPTSLRGRIEARGVGIVEVPCLREVAVALVVDLVAPGAVARLPEEASTRILGLAVPRMELDPFESSAPAKLRAALGGVIGRSAARGGEAQRPAGPDGAARRVVLVTGMSGAGHSTALKILEDMGYEAIDNLPLNLLDAALSEADSTLPIAIGTDIRARHFVAATVIDHFERLTARAELAVTLVFLDCQDGVLIRRFAETRRRHPLAHERGVAEGIAAERQLVAPLRERADLAVDTSHLSPGDLNRILSGHLGLEQDSGMAIFVTSFSYRHGLPREADFVLDVRFLANPHYLPALRPFDGLDPKVADHVQADPEFGGFFTRVTAMLEPLLPRFEQEGKSYLTIAVGCTGGRHRSVVVAERLAAWLREQGRCVNVAHRDVGTGQQA